ncbi:hypothetical protein M378DRAFT_156324 [Amanita muscaria Koide BX008]|uniref:DH domain-containing protein n=1 Tax=Amanita muscaria (strain Koide BX008) TaxID=946122 RepID=A0A0C2X7C8_AMAMK|nr:hypothetical protein M378DRAFT_156324 [Amanita muscaria Koide BX008]
MALSSSPRKTIPLATRDGPRPRSHSSAAATATTTKRVFFCAVVIEGSENGKRLPEEIQDLVLSFGDPLSSNSSSDMLSAGPGSSSNESEWPTQRRRAMTDTTALASVINELVSSERSYVKRLQILKNDYADPLRNFARSKETAILPAYEAKTLFGNIDNLVPVNEAFLTDLEKMMTPHGPKTVGGVGDVALRHFKELRGFEQYKQYYIKREEAQSIFEREVSKRSSRFGAYIDHIKYQSTDARNRVGLRELLMEPVQRIPRYTLLFRTMLKHMGPDDSQRAKLVEADEIASKIAQAEADEETKRAAIFYCLSTSIEGFPPELFSSSRRFIDCIDVEDVLNDAPLSSAASSASASVTTLHCSLFLFDDKILIIKRPGNGEKGGRTLAGLDDLDKVTKSGGIPIGKKKSGMSCKGVVDITDIVATDVGGADFHLYLENPPQDQSDRWSGRPFRSMSVVHPPLSANLDPIQTEADKQIFLERLWQVQAKYRTRAGQSVVLCSKEQEVESKAGKVTYARTYYNVYQRTAFLQEQKKTKIVVHIDPIGSADLIPFGIDGPPFARIRIQPMAGGLCRYSVSSTDPTDEGEEDIVQTERVPSRIVQTIHQFGLFQFRTGRDSRPSTPTARSKVTIFGLDTISRNIFSSRPASAMGDFFGGSINGNRRMKSTNSRSSTYTQTTSTGDGSLMKFSHRSNSTAATTVSSLDDDDDFTFSTSTQPRRSHKSPGGNTTDSDQDTPSRSLSRRSSEPVSRERTPDYSDDEAMINKMKKLDTSDWDLAMKLELARQNSMNQHGKPGTDLVLERPVEDTIYEEDPPPSLRPTSRSSRRSHTPVSTDQEDAGKSSSASPLHLRSLSRDSGDHRLFGPRSPSPLPRTPSPRKPTHTLPSFDDELEKIPTYLPPTSLPRSRRQLFPSSRGDDTPRTTTTGNSGVPSTIEPLSIKKKSSVRSAANVPGSPTTARRSYVRNSPLNRPSGRIVSPRRVPSLVRRGKPIGSLSVIDSEFTERLVQYSESTKEDIESSRRNVKRIKLEVNELRLPQTFSEPLTRPSSPDKSVRSSQPSSQPLTRAAQERLQEMRQVIGLRQGDYTPRSRPQNSFDVNRMSPTVDQHHVDRVIQAVGDLATQTDKDLDQALLHQEKLQESVRKLIADSRDKTIELEKCKFEFQHSKRQCELMKSLLSDATAEKEIMYEAFNEELDGMYNDVNLPDDEAWVALTADLRQTKEARNALSRENSQLKRHLAEVELERDEWGKLLRTHGLLP